MHGQDNPKRLTVRYWTSDPRRVQYIVAAVDETWYPGLAMWAKTDPGMKSNTIREVAERNGMPPNANISSWQIGGFNQGSGGMAFGEGASITPPK